MRFFADIATQGGLTLALGAAARFPARLTLMRSPTLQYSHLLQADR